MLFALREWRFSKTIRSVDQSEEGVYLLPTKTSAAWSAGIFHNAICVSKAFWTSLTSSERQALVAHERRHMSKRDGWLFFLLGVTESFFVDPISRRAIARITRDARLRSEFDADQAAIQSTSRTILASLLYKRSCLNHPLQRVRQVLRALFTNALNISQMEQLLRHERCALL